MTMFTAEVRAKWQSREDNVASIILHDDLEPYYRDMQAAKCHLFSLEMPGHTFFLAIRSEEEFNLMFEENVIGGDSKVHQAFERMLLAEPWLKLDPLDTEYTLRVIVPEPKEPAPEPTAGEALEHWIKRIKEMELEAILNERDEEK